MMNRGGNCSIGSGLFHFAWVILSISLFLCLIFLPNRAAAYLTEITASAISPPTHVTTHSGGDYHPLSTAGLISIVSATAELSTANGQAITDCALYGMDSCWDTTIWGYANGLGIEPMVFARASVDQYAISDPYICGKGFAMLAVDHKIKFKPDTPEDIISTIISTIDHIPLRVAYRMEVTGIRSYGTIRVFHGGTLIREVICKGEILEKFGTMSIPVPATGGTYRIVATAWVFADFVSRFEQVAVDPFLYIEPSWQYAKHFHVLQESMLNEGEWVEVTRKWQNPVPVPVPAPAILLLLLLED